MWACFSNLLRYAKAEHSDRCRDREKERDRGEKKTETDTVYRETGTRQRDLSARSAALAGGEACILLSKLL